MSADTVEEEHWEGAVQPRIESVQVGGWPGLGGEVGFSLGQRHTILVGRNSAGKSLLVEGLTQAARVAVGMQGARPTPPLSFRCVVEIQRSSVAYEYRIHVDEADEESEGVAESSRWRWQERCWQPANGQEIWRVEESKLVIAGEGSTPFAPGVGLLALDGSPRRPAQVESLRITLTGIRAVPAGVPRSEGVRREVLVPSTIVRGVRRWRNPMAFGRVHLLASTTLNMWERDRPRYDEFRQILLDLKLVDDVAVTIYEDPKAGVTGDRKDFAAVLFNGVNLGYQSDGTLRVAETVSKLLTPGVRCLLIEEPETAVHPSLLGRLLALIDSYSLDRQIVISTHSPQVVDWGGPDDLRLVVREGDATVVRPLGEGELASLGTTPTTTRILRRGWTSSSALSGAVRSERSASSSMR